MSGSDSGQVSRDAAEVYEEYFVPALFQQWPPRVAAAANIRSGQRVLDVACGTGVLARHVSERVGPAGEVMGLDLNDGMLAVARRKAPTLDWQQGQAEALPWPNDSFDAVVSQFGLMFFGDRREALQEMTRVLKPDGRLAIAVWDSLEHAPGYTALTHLLETLFGDRVARALRAPFGMGDRELLRSILSEAGLDGAQIETERGSARFPSIASWIQTEIRGWTLADDLNNDQLDLLLREAERALRPFTTADGTVSFDAPAHIVSVVKDREVARS